MAVFLVNTYIRLASSYEWKKTMAAVEGGRQSVLQRPPSPKKLTF